MTYTFWYHPLVGVLELLGGYKSKVSIDKADYYYKTAVEMERRVAVKSSLNKKNILITGAASGLGAMLAKKAASLGGYLILVDLNPQLLQEVSDAIYKQYAIKSILKVMDVSDRKAWCDFSNELREKNISVDVLVNNAGIAISPKRFQEIDFEQFDRILEINLNGALYGIRYILPLIENRTGNGIINISSLGGQLGLYGYSPYSMSKFALRGLGEALQMEYAGEPMHHLLVYPGGIKTNIMKNAINVSKEDAETAHNRFQKMASLTPEKAASKIWSAFLNKRNRLVIGSEARVILTLNRILGKWSLKLLKTMFAFQSKLQ